MQLRVHIKMPFTVLTDRCMVQLPENIWGEGWGQLQSFWTAVWLAFDSPSSCAQPEINLPQTYRQIATSRLCVVKHSNGQLGHFLVYSIQSDAPVKQPSNIPFMIYNMILLPRAELYTLTQLYHVATNPVVQLGHMNRSTSTSQAGRQDVTDMRKNWPLTVNSGQSLFKDALGKMSRVNLLINVLPALGYLNCSPPLWPSG